MSSEETVISEFHGFSKTSNFDCTYSYFMKNSCSNLSSAKVSSDLNNYDMFSTNVISTNAKETSQPVLNPNQNELINPNWNSDDLQGKSKIFSVLQRPPVVVDAQLPDSSPKRRKLVYAPISPVPQTNTPLKNASPEVTGCKSEEKLVVLRNDDIYNTYSKNRGWWDMQKSAAKTEQLLGHYYTNMLSYNDIDTPRKIEYHEDTVENAIDISVKTDETPRSVTTNKTDGSNNESTPAKSNDDSTSEIKTISSVKISPPFLSMENSNNATDNSIKIMEKLNLKSDLCHDFTGPLSFENKIPKIKSKIKQKYADTLNPDDVNLSDSNLMKHEIENSQYAPTSPCLFSSEDSDDEDMDQANSIGFMNRTPQDIEKDRLKQNDLELLKRLQKTLSGVLPPPSVTITQLDLSQILNLYKTNLSNQETRASQQQLTPRKRTLTDSILDNNSSTTPPSLKSSVSLPIGFEGIKFSESESLPPINKNDSSTSLHNSSGLDVSNSLLISCTLDDVLKASWPDVIDCRYHGVHYNRSSVSEEFELLCMKFAERYVGAETQTSCTLGNKPYSKKSTVSRYTQSPGRRLSHLARRRQTFSSANLQAGCSLEVKTRKPVASARQIMLSTKRNDNVARRRYKPVATRRTPGRKTPGKKTPGRKTPGRRTPGRKTPGRKTPGKKTPGKSTPSTSTKKRKLVCRRIIPEDHESSSSCSSSSMKPTRESSKRALFQSPPQNSLSRDETSAFSFGSEKLQRPKRALFSSPTKEDDETAANNRHCDMKKRVNLSSANTANHSSVLSPFKNVTSDKRKRKFSEICDSASQDSPKSKFPRSLSFNAAPSGGKVLTRRASENVVSSSSRQSSNCELSDNHRKKLLWAVAEALRSQNIGMSHPQFKSHAAVLARLTRKLLLEDTQRVGSTSEKMLRLAKLHVFSVIKGKTVEEIMIEEHIRKAKSCTSKVTGYVPLSEYEQSKISALNQRLIKPIIKDNAACGNRSKISEPTNSSSNSNTFLDLDSSNSLTKSVLQDKSLNLENNLLNPKIKARRQICFDDCAKR